MELYQIWTTYNKEWSKRETILFGAIFVLNIVLAVRGVYREKINSIQAMAFWEYPKVCVNLQTDVR